MGLPNRRLKLTGPASKGIVRLCAGGPDDPGHGSLRPSAFAPQLKRDPLGRPMIVQRVFWLLPTLRRFIRLEPRTRFRSGVGLPVSRLVPMVVILLAPCVAGCPMPISHTETVSPPIVGIVRGPDDRPVRNVAVAV